MTYQEMIDAGLMSTEQAVQDLKRRGHEFSLTDRIRLKLFYGISTRRDLLKEQRRRNGFFE